MNPLVDVPPQAIGLPKLPRPTITEAQEYLRVTSEGFQQNLFVNGSRGAGLKSVVMFNKHTAPAYVHLYDVGIYQDPSTIGGITLLTDLDSGIGYSVIGGDPTDYYVFYFTAETAAPNTPSEIGVKTRFTYVAGLDADGVTMQGILPAGMDFYLSRFPELDDSSTNCNGVCYRIHRSFLGALNGTDFVTSKDATLFAGGDGKVAGNFIYNWFEFPPILVPAGSNASLDFAYARKFTNGLELVASSQKDSYSALGNHMMYDVVMAK